MKMRKLVAVVVAVLMLCCIIPFSAMAEGSSASIDFGDKANRVSYSTSQQVWAQNGITVTNDKAASTSNVGDYGGDGYPVRFYKGSAVTVEYPGMTKIEFNCDDYKASYATDLQASISGATATLNGTVVTVAFDAPVDSFVIEQLVAQVRVDSINVYTGEGGDAPIVPDEPDVPGTEDPEADTELSIADAVALGLSKEHNTYTEGKYFVTGVITEVYSTQWGNMYITDGNGNTLTIYGSYSADGELRYDAMDVQPVAGDTVTVYGIIGQYNGKPQIKNGWITSHIPGETPDEPDEPVTPDEPDVPTGETLTIAEAIALGLSKEHNVYTADKYYVTGVITEVYNTQYGNMKLTDEDGNILTIYGTYSADGELRYDAMDVKPVAGDTVTIYGIVGQYNGTPQIKNGWIVEHIPAETPDEPDEPVTPDEPDEPVVPSEPVAPSVDTAFKFGMTQGNLENKVFYLAGGMDSYYMATTEDINAAIDVYLEETEGGFYFYTIENGAKKYINMVVSGTHVNGAYEDAASTVYTYDAEAQTLVADVEGASYWFATRNDNTYTTMGPCKTEYQGFYGKFYTAGGEPVEPENPDEPGTDSPVTGDNGTVYVTLAVVLIALAAAAAFITSKKRA